MHMQHEWVEKAKLIDFDGLETRVREGIAALRLIAQNPEKAGYGLDLHDKICRDMVFPWVYHLAEFLQGVKIGESQDGDGTLDVEVNTP